MNMNFFKSKYSAFRANQSNLALNKKGVSLVSLSIAIVIMTLITTTIVLSTTRNLRAGELDNMYNDIRILKEKVEAYYLEYGRLPLGSEYTGTIPQEVVNPNDDNKYYKINLNAMKNLTLHTEINEESFYVINEQSHTIYYPKGIELDGVTYYSLPEEYVKINN